MGDPPLDWNSCGDPQTAARVALGGLMSGVSEKLFFAEWLQDLEYILWRVAHGERGRVSERQALLLRLLADEAGGWIRPRESDGELELVPMPDWQADVAARGPQGPAWW